MSSASQKVFLNCLNDFEKLLAEETFALKKGNFEYLNQLLKTKSRALDELVKNKQQANIQSGQHAELDARVKAVIDQQEANRRAINTLLAANLAEQKKLHSQTKQVRNVCGTYTAAIASGKHSVAKANFQA